MLQACAPSHRDGPSFPRLLADVGGTSARFGWQAQEHAAISRVRVLPCQEYEGLAQALQAYLQLESLEPPACAAIGIATAVLGDWLTMTNHHWQFSVSALRAQLGLQRLVLLNDFTALALALPSLGEQALRKIGGAAPESGANIGLLGPGTGLGVSGLVRDASNGLLLPIAGEGGHVTLAASNALEFSVIDILRRRYGHVSAERVLSGNGLVNLYEALAEVDGQTCERLTPSQVMERALQGSEDVRAPQSPDGPTPKPDLRAMQALDLFCGFLGQVAGDLALTLGARAGVYIGGGIVPRMGRYFEQSPFRSRFEAKGRYSSYLKTIPVWLIDSTIAAALIGAAQSLSLPESLLKNVEPA